MLNFKPALVASKGWLVGLSKTFASFGAERRRSYPPAPRKRALRTSAWLAAGLASALLAAPQGAWALSAACSAIHNGTPDLGSSLGSFNGTYRVSSDGNNRDYTYTNPSDLFTNGEVISWSYSNNTKNIYVNFVVTNGGNTAEAPNSVYNQTANSGSGTITVSGASSGDMFQIGVSPGPYSGIDDPARYNSSVNITVDCGVAAAAPTLFNASPSAGPVAGGTSVTLTGTNFVAGATSVTFGGSAGTGITVNSATSLTVTTPAHAAGAVNVVVTTTGGSATLTNGFTYAAVPTLSGVSPSVGPTGGGTSVTLSGTGFVAGSTSVTFDGVAASGVTVNSATSLTATTPAHAAGAVDVAVATAGGTGTLVGGFAYSGAPSVTAVNPGSGPASGANAVVISGTNFTGATAVSFGGTAATSFTVDSSTQITATAPSHSAGTVDITVTTPGGTSATSGADQYTFEASPTVTNVSPTSGPTGGGTSVTITGTNFSTASAVKFGATSASYVINSSTQITATAPAHASGTVDVTVVTPGGTSATSAADQFTYLSAPTVTSVSPTSGPQAGGTLVTLTGTNFTGVTAVTFGGTAATGFTFVNATTLTATAPAGTGVVDIRVTTGGGTSATSAADQFTYVAAPTITSISPTSGPQSGGTAVSLTGTDFTGVTAVTFGGVAATGFTFNSATSITATAPAGTGVVDIRVTTGGGTSATSVADQYTYVAAPSVTGVSPTSGPTGGGTTVVVTGSGFTGAAAVTFGGTAATGFTVDSATQITATAPAGAGTVDIRVTTGGGTSATSAADQYTYVAAPTVTGISPTSGPVSGGTSVTITGAGFTGATAVNFGGASATSYTVNSDTQIVATAPAGAGTVDIQVTTSGGVSTTSAADQYTYVAAPSVTGVSPASGPNAGGTLVTITGTGFSGVSSVTFGGVAATGFTVVSATQITATAPAGTGVVDILVTTTGGTSSATASDHFTYTAAPTVSAISPNHGPAAGGTSVTLTGTGFTGATGVSFGATAATGFTVDSATSITATAPAGTGTVDIVVTGVGGTSPTSAADQFTYGDAPAITSVSPTSGPTAGGTSVTVTGANFTGATAVKFGAVNATSFTITSATSLTAVSPAGSAGVVDLTVTTAFGTSPTSAADRFTYGDAPSVTSLSLSSGPATGGSSIVITGANFTGATAVSFGATAATSFTVDSATAITAFVPAGTGTVDVLVTTPLGTSSANAADRYTYVAAPSISAVAPASGLAAGGTSVTVTGSGFTGATAVMFGASAATSFTVNSDTSLTAVSPAGTGTVDIRVTGPGGTSPAIGADQFTYGDLPSVSGLAPNTGLPAGGTSVVISGANFTGANAVAFGGQAATSFTVDSATQITAVAPAGAAGVVDVVVTTGYGASAVSANDQFTYAVPNPVLTAPVAAPTVSLTLGVNVAIVPVAGAGGTGTLTYALSGGALPTGLSFSASTGEIAGAATATLAATVFTVTVTDQATPPASVSQTFTLSVGENPPIVAAVTLSTAFETALTADLAAKVTGTHTTLQVSTAPGHGTASFNGDVLTYTPETGFSGDDSLAYTATGPGGVSAPATIQITVATQPPPVAQPASGSVATGTTNASTALDINLSSLITGDFTSVEISTPPQHGTVTVSTAAAPARAAAVRMTAAATRPNIVAIYKPNEGYVGPDSYSFVAVGPGGRSAPAAVSITVTGAVPKAQDIVAKTLGGRAVTVLLTAGATEGPFTAANVVSINPTNAGKAAVSESGTGASKAYSLTFTPEGPFTGSAVVTYTLSNQYGVSAPAKVTITVEPRPDPTQDPEVNALIDAQAEMTRRFATAQISNFVRRNEGLHGAGSGGGGLGLAPGVTDSVQYDLDRYLNGGRDAVERIDASDPVLRVMNRLTPEQEANAFAQGGGVDRPTDQDAGPRRVGQIEGWAAGTITVGRRDALGSAAKFDLTSSGLSAGADLKLSPGLAFGVGGGAGRDTVKVGSDASRIEGRNWVVAAYGSAEPVEGVFVDGVVGVGGLDYRMRRAVAAIGAQATGQRDGDVTFASLTGAVDRGDAALRWSAYGRLDYVGAKLDGYSETGADLYNLAFASRRLDSLSGVLGGRMSFDRQIAKDRVLTPSLRLELRHEFQEAKGETIRYADWLTGPSYLSAGRGWARDRLSLGAGVGLRDLGGWKFDLEAAADMARDELFGSLRAQGSIAF